MAKVRQLPFRAYILEHMFVDAELDPLAEAREGLARLAGEDRSAWNGAALSDRVRELASVVERAEAELVRCVGEWDARMAWAEEGSLSATSWLRHRGPFTSGAAARLVRTARLAHQHARTAKALASGDVTVAHVGAMAIAARHREDLFAEHEDVLLDLVPTLQPDTFAIAMHRWRDAADDELARIDAFDAFERRYLHVSRTLGGNYAVEGMLDAEGGASLVAELERRDRVDAADDPAPPRSAAQRRADTLVDMARQSAARERGDAGSTAMRRTLPNLDAVFDADRVDREPVDLTTPTCSINGAPVPRVVVERLSCDANVARVVMRGRSEVLDLGRRTRLVSRAQFRALVRRDGHCQFPGCDRPPQWTDAHHIVAWTRGGATDLDNLVLLCRRHHVLRHEGGWQLRRDASGQIDVEAPAEPRPRHRARARARAPG
jgi:hypothetical protein